MDRKKKKFFIYAVILSLSLFSFLVKGILYAFIGSSLPLLMVVAFVGMFYLSRNKMKLHDAILKIWCLALIFWALARIFIGAMNHFKPLMENHLHEQLGVNGVIISILVLFCGIYLIKKENRNQWMQDLYRIVYKI